MLARLKNEIENDLIMLSVVLVFSSGMFVSHGPGYYKVICQAGNIFEGNFYTSC